MYAGTSGGQGGSGREQSCECSGQANVRMSLPFSSALCFYVGVYVFMYDDDGAYCQIHLFFAAFICMNINEVTGMYVCMLLHAPGAAKAVSVCFYALIMRYEFT